MADQVDVDLLAARRFAATMSDAQRAMLTAICSRPDSARLLAETMAEGKRWASFGSDALKPNEVMLLAAVDHALSRYGYEASRLAKQVAADWDDLSLEVRARIQDRAAQAIETEEPGTMLDASAWKDIGELNVTVHVPGMTC